MDHVLTAVWEAHHPLKNHHRRYEIVVARDLLDHWTLTIYYGRTGLPGRELRYAATNVESIRAILHNRLSRRRSAPKRIDCAYRITRSEVAACIDPKEWLTEI